jgi:hypothetical protein
MPSNSEKAAEKLELEKRMLCAKHGHTRVSTIFWGYRHCARCGAQVGDTLGSIDPGRETAVIVGHNCKQCRSNWKKLAPHEKLLIPNPFKKEAQNAKQ